MANTAGRDMVVKKGGTVIASVTTKSVNWQGTLIDITSDDDDGATTYLADVFANTTLEMSVDGFTDDDVLSDLAFSATDSDKHLSDLTLERANGDAISGTFIITSYQETGASAEGSTFTASIVRSGIHTWAPAA